MDGPRTAGNGGRRTKKCSHLSCQHVSIYYLFLTPTYLPLPLHVNRLFVVKDPSIPPCARKVATVHSMDACVGQMKGRGEAVTFALRIPQVYGRLAAHVWLGPL